MNMEETARVRYEEAKKAAAVLDADYYTLGGVDGFLYDTKEMRIESYFSYQAGEEPELFSHIFQTIIILITGQLQILLR